jgi:hypothetical protein
LSCCLCRGLRNYRRSARWATGPPVTGLGGPTPVGHGSRWPVPFRFKRAIVVGASARLVRGLFGCLSGTAGTMAGAGA